MSHLLQIDFPYSGPWQNEMTEALEDLAISISQEPGLIWKIWTANEKAQEAGGIYLFQDRASAEAYLSMHTARLKELGIHQANVKLFEVNEGLTAINGGPV